MRVILAHTYKRLSHFPITNRLRRFSFFIRFFWQISFQNYFLKSNILYIYFTFIGNLPSNRQKPMFAATG